MLIQTTKPQFPHLQQGILAPHRWSRGSLRTPRHGSQQAPSHVLTPGEELQGCSLSKSLKALKGQCCHTHCVLANNKVWTQYLLQFSPPWGNRESTLCLQSLYPVSPHPMPEQGQPWPRPGFPLPIDIPRSLRRFCLVSSNLSEKGSPKHLQRDYRNGTTPLPVCPWHGENWLSAGTNSKAFLFGVCLRFQIIQGLPFFY